MSDKVIPEDDTTDASGKGETKYPEDFTEKVLKEKKNVVEVNKGLKDELEKLREEISRRDKEKLAEKDNFKELLAMTEKEKTEIKQQLNTLKSALTEAKKVSALKSEFTKLGLNQQYTEQALKLADKGKVIVDDDTSIVTGADLCAKLVFESVPVFFQTPKPGVSHAAPEGLAKPIDLEIWKKLSPDEKKKREPELYESLGIKRKK